MSINYEQVGKVEAMLTSLKWDSDYFDHDAFGNGVADKQIKAINEALKIFGARFIYEGPDFTARIVVDEQ